MKNMILVLLVMLSFLNSCKTEDQLFQLDKEKMLEIALYQKNYHLQSDVEVDLIKKHNIKSASFITERFLTNETDSTTYLLYNHEGYLISRVTTECTTVGCLPYVIKQEFTYENNKIKQMKDYTFKRKYKTVSEYWAVKDANELSKFDWEDFTYKLDTIRVESGAFVWCYVFNSNGKLIAQTERAKTNNQIMKSLYNYSNSNISINYTDSIQDSVIIVNYKVVENNKVRFQRRMNADVIFSVEYLFDSKGLLKEKTSYENEKQISRTTITYSKFEH